MSRRHLNLAARPFVNARPVARVTTLLAVLAAGVLIADAVLFWGYYRGRTDQREQLRQLEADVATERREVAELARQIGAVRIDQQNRRAAYLNQKITQRTFAWGQLFDHLATILPNDVRLLSLKPEPIAAGPRRGSAAATGRTAASRRTAADQSAAPAPTEERVALAIEGASRRDEAILELLDTLFADPAFSSPNLAREAQQQGEVRFSLTVIYHPQALADRSGNGAAGTAPAAPETTDGAGGPPPATAEAAPPGMPGGERS